MPPASAGSAPLDARERILDAAERCLRRDGLRRTTVAAVADEAGLSRAYLYRFFPDRLGLLAATLIHRDEEFWELARRRVGAVAGEGMAAMVAEAVVLSQGAPLGPLALELAEAEPDAYVSVVAAYTQQVVAGLSGFWVRMLHLGVRRGSVRADLDVDAAAEWALRTVISLVAVPSARLDVSDVEAVRAYLETFLAPAFRVTP